MPADSGNPDPHSSENWKRIEDLFHGALEQPKEGRAQWLAALSGEPAIEKEVRSLLASLEKQDRRSAAEPALGTDAPIELASVPAGRFGAYRLVRLIAHGGMSSVYRAERADGLFERNVAIKVIAAHLGTDDFLRRFQNEGKLLAALQHPNVATLLDGGISPAGYPYLVLELVEGERLDRHCDASRLSVAARLQLFRQVCEAVAYAHRNGILHRDLKPANILVTAEGVVKLVDFGTASLVSPDTQADTMRATMLTPRYSSPEQLTGVRPGIPSDVYSLGVILYELLSGVWPFGDPGSVVGELRRATGEASPQQLTSVLTAEAAELRASDHASLRREVDGNLSAIVNKALQSDPARRYATVPDLIHDLDAASRARRFVRRTRWWLAAAALLLTAAVLYLNYARPGVPNRKASDLFQLGQYHWNRRTPESLLKAVDLFQQAAGADPHFARAYAFMADSCAMLPEYGNSDASLIEAGRKAGRRALELDDSLSMAHGALAWIAFSYDWNWDAAEPEFRAAIALAPRQALPHQRYGLALIARGRFAEAEANLRQAQELEPVSVISMINLAELWYYTRRFDREEEQLQRVLELDPNSILAYAMLAKLKTVSGQSKEAVQLAERMQSLPEGATWCQELAEAYARDGQRAAALRRASTCSGAPVYPGTYEYLGDYGHAMDAMELRFAQHNPYLQYLNVDPNYDELRHEPRFQQLLKKLGF